jgi:hypothetical protein
LRSAADMKERSKEPARIQHTKEKTVTLGKSISTAAVSTVFAFAMAALPAPAFSQGANQQNAQPRHTAEEIAKSKPSATFDLEAEQVRLILGGSSGKGTLHFKGKSYPFTMKGGTVGGVGVTKVNASGNVYFLNSVQDFGGTYSAITAGAAVGAGGGLSQYENDKGVYVAVKSKTEGVALNMGLGVVEVSLSK